MSRSHRDTRRRTAHKTAVASRDAFNADDLLLYNELQRQIPFNGGITRYGNHRKWVAAEKVRQRRRDRRTAKGFEKD